MLINRVRVQPVSRHVEHQTFVNIEKSCIFCSWYIPRNLAIASWGVRPLASAASGRGLAVAAAALVALVPYATGG